MFFACSLSMAFNSLDVADCVNKGEMKNCENLSSASSVKSAFTSK